MTRTVSDVAEDLTGVVEETLAAFEAIDYMRHTHHHLRQILDPEGSRGKTHPPFA